MNPVTLFRVVRDCYIADGAKANFWKARSLAVEISRLFRRENRRFLGRVIQEQMLHLFGSVRPIEGAASERAHAAMAWLLRAQQATEDDGVSFGFFPCSTELDGWKPSYPETTGYIITSLLAYADRYDDESVRAAALRMAYWEVAVQMDSGAVQGGPVCRRDRQTPAAFNTGMVLDGWCSAYEATRDTRILDAARRAANFLVGDLDDQGYFRTNGAFVPAGEIKTYSCLCAWAIYRFGELTGEARYRDEAIRCIEAALRQQRSNGWIAHNCLTRSEAPLTHTIGYALQGILEVGIAAARPDFIGAVRAAFDRIRERIRPTGYLPGRFYDDWEPAQLSSCLTGSAQLAIVGYRLYDRFNDEVYRRAADRLLNFLKALQTLDPRDAAIHGALAGSFPLLGAYMRAGYPNWATKYLLDALMIQDRIENPRATW